MNTQNRFQILQLQIGIILFPLVLDQLSKIFVVSGLIAEQQVFSFFSIDLLYNHGIAFGIPIPLWLIILFGITASIFFLVRFFVVPKRIIDPSFSDLFSFEKISMGLLFAGAFGNTLDRIFRGAVVDFFSFWSFPVFNFADIFITFGVVLLFFSHFSRQKN